jgi:hypothetical protein
MGVSFIGIPPSDRDGHLSRQWANTHNICGRVKRALRASIDTHRAGNVFERMIV